MHPDARGRYIGRGCSTIITNPTVSSAGHQRTFQVHGQIRAVDVAGKTVRIAHEEIPNYMPAMIMPFPVKNADILKGFSAGENVQFELVVTENDSWISHIEMIAGDSPAETAGIQTTSASAQNADAGRIRAGEVVPDFALIDQNGRPNPIERFSRQGGGADLYLHALSAAQFLPVDVEKLCGPSATIEQGVP